MQLYSHPYHDRTLTPMQNAEDIVKNASTDLELKEAYLVDTKLKKIPSISDHILIVVFEEEKKVNMINLCQRLALQAAPLIIEVIDVSKIDSVLQERYCEIFRRDSHDLERQEHFNNMIISSHFRPVR